MNDFKIMIKDDVYLTENKSVINTIFFIEVINKSFPFENWTDFTFPILEEWKNNLLRIRHRKNTSTHFYFHDGPFWLNLYKDENMNLRIECINGRKTESCEATIYCSYRELLEELYKAIKVFIKILYNNNLNTGDFASVYEQSIMSKDELKLFLEENDIIINQISSNQNK